MPDEILESIVSTGQLEKFKQLSLDDVMTILATEKAEKKKQLKANMADAGVSGIDALGFLQSFDSDETTIFRQAPPEEGWNGPEPLSLQGFIGHDRGRTTIVEFAFKGANEGRPLPSLTTDERFTVMRRLVEPLGFVFGKADVPADKKTGASEGTTGDDPNAGKAYGK